MSKYRFFRRHPGEGTPMILAIVLVLLILFCTVAEFSRVWIIAQGVKEAAQQAVISTINDNYHSNIASCSRSHCTPGAFLHFGALLPRCRGPPFSRFASPPNLEKTEDKKCRITMTHIGSII